MASYRYLTCAALTGQVLAWDLPLSDVSYGPELNGPGSLQATLEPHLAHVLGSMIDPGNTFIFAERHSKLMWGGLIWRAEPEGGRYPIEAAGFGSYLNKRHDMHGNLDGRGPYTYGDPCKVIRDVWGYCQAQADGNLGVVVDSATSKATIGTPEEPYASTWWESRALADIVADAVAVFGGPEWTEQVAWVGGLPERRIRLGWPRLGTRRTDVSFTTGVNIADLQPVIYDGDSYAQVVAALGSGEGQARLRAIDAVRDGRLRLEDVLDLPTVKGKDQLAAKARAGRIARQKRGSIEQVDIIDHPAARFGSFQVGDDVWVQVHDEWTDYDGWARVTAWTLTPAQGDQQERMTVSLAPADSFIYGG
ncbi:hypothetical protein [Streptomyces canus]|uniref:hypothetical protein n=1 Tax=Streptomyces canus TaxID=58343 RepID=UPI00225019E4|nr:hypothetical protein [Streptomyces canus]MCX4858319.1 hypothetical protein [Streptomyces canus]